MAPLLLIIAGELLGCIFGYSYALLKIEEDTKLRDSEDQLEKLKSIQK